MFFKLIILKIINKEKYITIPHNTSNIRLIKLLKNNIFFNKIIIADIINPKKTGIIICLLFIPNLIYFFNESKFIEQEIKYIKLLTIAKPIIFISDFKAIISVKKIFIKSAIAQPFAGSVYFPFACKIAVVNEITESQIIFKQDICIDKTATGKNIGSMVGKQTARTNSDTAISPKAHGTANNQT